MQLTPEEIELCEKLKFDRAVVAEIKAMVKVPLREYLGAKSIPQDKNNRGLGELWTPERKQERIELLNDMAKRSPDASDRIAGWIDELRGPPDEGELLQLAKLERDKEFFEKSKPFHAYLEAENERIRKDMLSGMVAIPGFLVDDKPEITVDQRIEQMRKFYEGKPLPKVQKKPSPKGLVFRMESMNWLVNMGRLNKMLASYDYKLEELGSFRPDFKSQVESEVRDYCAKLEIELSDKNVLSLGPQCLPLTDDYSGRSYWVGDEIIRLGRDGLEIYRPKHYSVNILSVVVVLLRKKKKSTRRDKFEMVKDACTSAPNYQIGHDLILEKLKYWDAQYDIEIESARYDSVTVVFRKLPEDIRQLCNEILMFCADLDVLHPGSYEENSTRAREFASRLRKSGKIGFWWD